MDYKNLFHLSSAPPLRTFFMIARVCGMCALAIGLLGFTGWLLDVTAFKSVFLGLATMKTNTAIGFILGGLAVLLAPSSQLPPQRRQIVHVLAFGVLLLSVLTILEYVLRVDLRIDEILFRDFDTPVNAFPGRMSPATAASFLLVAAAILALVWLRQHVIGQLLAGVVVFISLAALIGYFYRVESLYSTFFFNTMALHTAVGFLLLGVGVLHINPEHGFMTIFLEAGPSGRLARWLIPCAVFLPAMLGWIVASGSEHGAYDIIFAFDLFILGSIILFTTVIGWNAFVTRRTDRARRQAEEALMRRNQAYRTLSRCNQTLIRATGEDDLLNQVCENITHVGGYVAAWCGMAETSDEVNVVSMSVRPDLLVPNNNDRPVDPTHLRTYTTRALATEEVQSVVDVVSALPQCTSEAAHLGYSSIGVLPILDESMVYGVLVVYSSVQTGFDEQEMDLLTELAGDLGYGITTIRMRTARQAAEAHVRYQASLLENISDAVIAVDLDFNIRDWNKAAEDIYGWNESEVMGTPLNETLQSAMIGDSFDRIVETLHRHGQWQGEIMQRHRDGAAVRILSSMSSIISPNGKINGLVAVNRDITDYMKMRDRMVEVEMQRREVEKEREMIALREQFMAMVSHDFRTPLTVIMTCGDLLERYRERLTPEKLREYMAKIREQAEFMVVLLDDVLSLSKTRAGRVQFQIADVDLRTFCTSLFEQVQVNATPAHRFRITWEGELESGRIDEHVFQRALLNLLSNAVKYSPEGGEVSFGIRRDGDDVVFTISDEGLGIPQQDQKHIFEPFHRASNTHKIQGTGLGMAIVYETVTLYGGTISFESDEGGTTFTVRMPYRKTLE